MKGGAPTCLPESCQWRLALPIHSKFYSPIRGNHSCLLDDLPLWEHCTLHPIYKLASLWDLMLDPLDLLLLLLLNQ